MKGRVDIVGTGLRRADFYATALQPRQNGKRYCRLAGARMRRGDDQPARGHFNSLFNSFAEIAVAPESSARSFTISPMTTMAGGSSFCARASPASRSSVETSTRCFGVVAE